MTTKCKQMFPATDKQTVDGLGVFCPFWSTEGPHFVLPLFQGMMHSFRLKSAILDLNIDCAEAMGKEWQQICENKGGTWSDSKAAAEIIAATGLAVRLITVIRENKPRWVFFLSANVSNYQVVRCLMHQVRRCLGPDPVKLAVGGPLCRHLDSNHEIFPDADLIWANSLESALPLLLEISAQPDTRYRADFTGIKMQRYRRPERIPYLLNYGCRYKCRFCHEGAQYEKEVARPYDGLAAELCELVSSLPTVRHVRFNDGSLNSDHRQFLGILDELDGSGLTWICNLTPSSRIDAETACRLAAAGCIAVNVGVESGSSRIRRLMAKPVVRIETVESCLRNLSEASIAVSINLMVGFPGETDADVEATLKFLTRSTRYIAEVAVGKTAIFSGTPLFDQVTSLGIELHEDESRQFLFNYWSLADRTNTPQIRSARLRKVEYYLRDLGLKNALSHERPERPKCVVTGEPIERRRTAKCAE